MSHECTNFPSYFSFRNTTEFLLVIQMQILRRILTKMETVNFKFYRKINFNLKFQRQKPSTVESRQWGQAVGVLKRERGLGHLSSSHFEPSDSHFASKFSKDLKSTQFRARAKQWTSLRIKSLSFSTTDSTAQLRCLYSSLSYIPRPIFHPWIPTIAYCSCP